MADYLPTVMSDLEAARSEAVRLLCRAHAEDRVSGETFAARLEQVRLAPNSATLAAILADLEPTQLSGYHSGAVPARQPADHTEVAAVSPADYLRLASTFGSTERAGSWTVPLALDARVLLGSMIIDLRDAVFGSDFVDIEVNVKLGSFTLIVPAGTQVENEVEEVLSASTHSTRSARGARPNGLLVRVRGKAMMASIDVKEKFPSKVGTGASFFERLLGSGD
jgi:hypothetical protein